MLSPTPLNSKPFSEGSLTLTNYLMSLKGFHILFITISTLLCIFVVLWAFVFASYSEMSLKVFGGVCAVMAIILPVYGIRFYRKSREI